MPNAEDEDMKMLQGMGQSNDSISEKLRKKKREEEEAKLRELIDKPSRKFIPD